VSGEYRPAVGDFPVGARIAGYQIQELLGRGGMAVVYRAADVRLDRQVALKVLAPELTKDSGFRQRFIRESRAGASVDHPNIIPVFEAGEAEGVLFIAMRFVAGRDVRALLEREGTLPPARTVSIVTQIASALDTAHARGLVHRDVKPANMLLGAVGSDTTPDHVYLSDFGLSKISASAISLTGTGQFLGTIDYMSPEQVEGRQTDGRTDQYALACATFEMLTGRPPFQRDQDLAVMWAQVSAPPPSVSELRGELPAAVDPVIAKALAKAPEQRHASCLEFAAALGAALAPSTRGQGSRPPPTELAAAVTPPVPPQAEFAEATITEAAHGAGAGGAAGQARARTPPATARDPGFGPGGPVSAPWQPQGQYQSPPPQRRRGRVAPVLVGLLTVAVLAGAAVFVLHLRGNEGSGRNGHSSSPPSPSPSSSQSSTRPPTTPRAVVTAYYRDLNLRHYLAAYRLNTYIHGSQTFSQFKCGYTTTQHDYLTITGISGDVVSLDLKAMHTDGNLYYLSGTLTVGHGKIVGSDVVWVSAQPQDQPPC